MLRSRLEKTSHRHAFAACLALLALSGAVRAEESGQPVSLTAGPGRGFTVETTDGRYSATLRPRIQLRSTTGLNGGDVTQEANVKTVRLWVTGNVLSKSIGYGLQLAFGGNDFDGARDGELKAPVSLSPVFDAWVEFTHLRDMNVRVGQFFVPFDRARTIREFGLQFVDRPLVVSELTLDRDVGVALTSKDLFGAGVLGYALFLGAGQGRNAFGAHPSSFLATARVTWHPFGAFDEDQESDLSREARPRLALGVAGGWSHGSRRQRVTTGNSFALGTADHQHAAADIVFKCAGLSFLGEFVWRGSSAEKLQKDDVSEWTRRGFGGFAQAGYLVTPRVEIVARWEQLWAAAGTDPKLVDLAASQGRAFTLGTNGYLNGHALKLQADYTLAGGGEALPNRHQLRLQLDATF
jgi:hypothetical protein